MAIQILILCSTNTSLSPLFQGIFQETLEGAGYEKDFTLQAAGTHAGKTPRPVERRTREIAEKHGIVLPETLSRNCGVEDLQAAKLILCMKELDFWHAKDLLPSLNATKLRLLMEFSGQLGIREMPDPLFDEISFEEAFEKLKAVTPKLLEECLGLFELRFREK